jgi:hypothetical protein
MRPMCRVASTRIAQPIYDNPTLYNLNIYFAYMTYKRQLLKLSKRESMERYYEIMLTSAYDHLKLNF